MITAEFNKARVPQPRDESDEHLVMKVKEESQKVDLKLNIQKTKIMASGPIITWQIDGKTMGTMTRLFS